MNLLNNAFCTYIWCFIEAEESMNAKAVQGVQIQVHWITVTFFELGRVV